MTTTLVRILKKEKEAERAKSRQVNMHKSHFYEIFHVLTWILNIHLNIYDIPTYQWSKRLIDRTYMKRQLYTFFISSFCTLTTWDIMDEWCGRLLQMAINISLFSRYVPAVPNGGRGSGCASIFHVFKALYGDEACWSTVIRVTTHIGHGRTFRDFCTHHVSCMSPILIINNFQWEFSPL